MHEKTDIEKNGKLHEATSVLAPARLKCSSWPCFTAKAFNNRDTLAMCAPLIKPRLNPLVLIAEVGRGKEYHLISIYTFAHVTVTHRSRKKKKNSEPNRVSFCAAYQRDINHELAKDDKTHARRISINSRRIVFPA